MSYRNVASLMIKLIDQVSGPAKSAASAITGVGKAANAVAKVASTKGVDNLAASLKKVDAAAKSIGKGFQADWSRGFQAEIDRAALSAKKLGEIKRSWQDLLRTLQSSGKVKPADFLPALDAWEKKTLSGMKRVQHEAQRTARSMRYGSSASFAAGALGVGSSAYAVNRTLRGTVKSAADSVRESARDYLSGLSTSQSAVLAQKAREASAKYPSVDAATMHERLRDTAMSTRSVEKALALSDTIAQGAAVLQSLKGKDKALEEGRRFFAALDVLGKNVDVDQVRSLFNGFIKAMSIEGADMDLGGVLTMARQSRAAGGILSDRFLWTTGSALQRDMGDAQVGSALASTLSQVIGKRATKTSMKVQERFGLRKRGKFLDAELMMSDPDLYAWEKLKPALAKKGVNVKDDKALAAAVTQLFSNRQVADIFTKLLQQEEQYRAKGGNGVGGYDAAPGLAAAGALPGKDPYVALAGMISQARNLAAAATDPLMPAATTALNGLASALSGLAKAAADNPVITGTATSVLGTAATGFGAYLGWKGIQSGWRWLHPGAAGGASAAAEAASVGATASRAATFGTMASRFAGPLGLALMAPGMIGTLKEATDPYAGLTAGERLRASRGGRSVRQTIRDALDARDRMSGNGQAPSATPLPWPDAPVPDKSDAAASAGQRTGSAYRDSLLRELENLEATVNLRVQGIMQKLNFRASPVITPQIAPAPASVRGAPAQGETRRASLDGLYDWNLREA
jgi:hypothetical protein